MMTYGTYLGATNSYTTGTIWPYVKLDLGNYRHTCPLVRSLTCFDGGIDYVANNWNK